MNLKLSKRLETIVLMCDYCDTIIDIGTDHGKVPITLANLLKAKKIIATDISEESLKACKKNAKLYLTDKKFDFSTIVSDGLSDIDKNIKAGIIITGMGYDVICNILSNINEYNFEYLIISPHSKVNDFIVYITKLGLSIIEEKTIYEEGKAYFIFKIVREKI